MTRDEQLAAIRQKCIAANPNILCCDVCGKEYQDSCFINHAGQKMRRPIRLADVLLAMIAHSHYPKMETSGTALVFFALDNETVLGTYDLRTDDLTQQSEETVAFIHSLIFV
jgi:hypothetical protein